MTHRYVLPFPVAPGKTASDAARIAKYFKAHMDQYLESRRRLGTDVERAYLQETPMGPAVITYVETAKGFKDWAQGLATSKLPIDQEFVDMVADIHGLDIRKLAAASPLPETIGEWVDPTVTKRKKGLAFIAPILPGKEAAVRSFVREAFVARKVDLIESRKALGQNAEVVTLNITPMGSFVCGYIEGVNPVKANQLFAASKRPYDVWFKNELQKLLPASVDFSQPLPPVKPIFDYVA